MKPTVRNIAERANVSIASVSLVLNNKPSRITEATRQKIIEAAKELGYNFEEKKKNEGKKLYVGDEKIMSEAQRLLHEEFALVLNIKVDEVLPFILGELEPTEKNNINL